MEGTGRSGKALLELCLLNFVYVAHGMCVLWCTRSQRTT